MTSPALKNYQTIANAMRVLRPDASWPPAAIMAQESALGRVLSNVPQFDDATELLVDASRETRLVFSVKCQHVDGFGPLGVWTAHRVIVTPSGSLTHPFSVRVTGPNRNGVRARIADTFRDWLNTDTQVF